MNRKLVLASLLLGCTAPAVRAQHAHAAPPGAPAHAQAASTVPAKAWATDAPLRAGMGRIRQSVDALDHARHDHLGPDQVRVLTGRIKADVNYLVTHCKLEPAADAALHGVIARLLQGAAALERQPDDAAAVEMLQDAVHEYARRFDDPAFKAERARPSPARP